MSVLRVPTIECHAVGAFLGNLDTEPDSRGFSRAIQVKPPLVIGRPYVAPPDVPAQRVAALRAALMGTFRDVGFLSEAEKLRLEVDATPQSGEDIRNVLTRTYAAPKPVLDRLRTIHEVGQKQASNQ